MIGTNLQEQQQQHQQQQPQHDVSMSVPPRPPPATPQLPSFDVTFTGPPPSTSAASPPYNPISPQNGDPSPFATGPVTLHHRNVPYPSLYPMQPPIQPVQPAADGSFAQQQQQPPPSSATYTLTDLNQAQARPMQFSPADITLALDQIDQCVRSVELDQLVRELQHLSPPPLDLPLDIDAFLLDGTDRLTISD